MDNPENLHNRVIAYIRDTIPDYEYNFRKQDFRVVSGENEPPSLVDWKLDSVPKPTERDLLDITEEEVNIIKSRKKVSLKLDVVKNVSKIDAKKGNIVYNETTSQLMIYDGNIWKSISTQ